MLLINAIRLIVEPYNDVTVTTQPNFGYKKILQLFCF